jgi:autoinducer 2 (AI-2) kinase
MRDKYILTLDIGTGSGRAILFNSEGSQVGTSQREWLPETLPEYPGAQNFNTQKVWQLLVECVKETIQKAGVDSSDIGGVTATSMREGMVLYDKKGEEIWACTNADARAKGEVEFTEQAATGSILFHLPASGG